MRVEVATPEHALAFAPHVSEDDRAELRRRGFELVPGLLHSLAVSTIAEALFIDGELAALFGFQAEVGHWDMWAMTSDVAARRRRDFLLASRVLLEQFLGYTRELRATVDSRHSGTLRWLRWLGFDIGEPHPGPAGLLFHSATIRRPQHV